MEIKPVDNTIQATPIRTPERLEAKEDGSVQIQPAADKVEIKKKAKPKVSGLEKSLTAGAKTILTGVGFGSGLVGGGIIGAGVGASGGLLQGITGAGITWAGVSGAGLIGGIAGAVLFGAAGAYGGWTFASLLIKSGKFLTKLLFTKEPLSEEQQAALGKIKEVEDNPKDATKALNFIAGKLAADEKLDAETDLYIGLVNHFSNKKSDMALSAYATLKENLPPGEERSAAIGELGKFSQTFKEPEASMDALYTVMQNLNAKDSLAKEGDSFRNITAALQKCSTNYGVVSPEIAGEAYKTIKANFAPDERDQAVAATLGQLAEIQVEPKVALGNLQALVQCRQKGDDLAGETKNLLYLMKKCDGNAESARFAYATAKTYFAPAEREEGLKIFFALNETEKSPQAAANVLGTISKGLYQGEKLAEQVDFYKSIRATGASADKSLEAYKTITSGFDKGKERTEALKQFEKLAAAETAAGQDAGNAAADFQFLTSHMSKGEKLGDEMDKFVTLLQSQKSSSAAQKAYADAKFKETYTA